MAEFCSRDVVEFRHQGRLAHVAEVLNSRLRQGEPIMPISQSILYALCLGNELHSFIRGAGKLCRIASSLAENAVLVQHSFAERRTGAVETIEHSFGDSQRIATRFRIEALGCAFQSLADLANGGFIELLAQLLFLLPSEFDQVIDELGLASRLPRHFQTAQCR